MVNACRDVVDDGAAGWHALVNPEFGSIEEGAFIVVGDAGDVVVDDGWSHGWCVWAVPSTWCGRWPAVSTEQGDQRQGGRDAKSF